MERFFIAEFISIRRLGMNGIRFLVGKDAVAFGMLRLWEMSCNIRVRVVTKREDESRRKLSLDSVRWVV